MTPYHTDIQVRFADTDAFGHLNNSAFAFYVEAARLDFFREVAGVSDGLILAHLALDFRKQVRFGEEVVVRTQVERLGSSSITLSQRVYADGEVASEVRSVVVMFDYEAQRPKRIPDEVREVLMSYLSRVVPFTKETT